VSDAAPHPVATGADVDALAGILERRFRTAHTLVQVAGRDVDLLHPANADDLISEADYVKDERLPYWADIWPSSHVLAAHVAGLEGSGRRILELGCGLGLVMTAAAHVGFEGLATDYYEDALLFAQVNVWRNAGALVAVRHVDWRDFPVDLGTFDLVVASDVLYERSYAPLLAYAYARTLPRGGRGIVADPGRIGRDAFLTECGGRGLAVRTMAEVPFATGKIRQSITLLEISRP
jgi:predicted nicotinamide N-methyase